MEGLDQKTILLVVMGKKKGHRIRILQVKNTETSSEENPAATKLKIEESSAKETLKRGNFS